ncbi:hypothetical protein TrST_g8180 [Triparma strigata]|uniref:AAA+ ATPase domain-containing protein n=1 Tax=Triparma strigata TaxID=1606541 RepID=A0A9W7BZM6_9STRA|nr:hypothetical protein TrST_g8180 [Triparma strigata]
MALTARHRFIIARLDEALLPGHESLFEDLIRTDSILARVNSLFHPEGLNRLIFTYYSPDSKDVPEMPDNLGDEGKEEKTSDALRESDVTGYAMAGNVETGWLLVTQGDDIAVTNRAVFFMKTKAKSGIDPTKSTDSAMTYGVIDSPLRNLEVVMRNIYKPLLQVSDNKTWGKASAEEQNELMVGVDNFVHNLEENLKSLNSGLELRKPEAYFESMGNSAALEPTAVSHYMELLEEWCTRIDNYLDDSDRSRWETNDSGPDSELEYWRRRMQRLTSITDQLKTRSCKTVIGVLTAVTKNPEDVSIDKQRVFSLVRQWKQIDLNITEAANEAKDNVKYLNTLERFIEPLYSGDPDTIIEMLPALLNALKMVHTIARYFNTTERMTKLFMKITNQMVSSCKLCLNGKNPPEAIWDQDPELLLENLESCLRLNEMYQEQYRITKDKLLTMPKGKQFDFSETQIFGKFDLFCRRVIKLIDMFSNIQQFKSLAEHKLDGMAPLIEAFGQIIAQVKSKGHDLLDFHSNKLDRDYVEFNVRIGELEQSLQIFINRSFESITSIDQSLTLLRKYQAILHRESLRQDLDSKFTVIFNNYGLELTSVQDTYEHFKHNPPCTRNMPPVSGNIMWARHLLRRIEEPMENFHGNSTVLKSKESKKIIKTYNKVARTLVAFEYLWYEAWVKSVDAAKAGLQATLIIRHPDTGKLYVNFDREILQLIREAKCLARIGVQVPESAQIVLLQEEKFKLYYNELKYALDEYERVCSLIVPVVAKLLKPHLQTLELKLRPGMITLTWTSMNIENYKMHIHIGLQRLEELVNKINDIVDNRIEKNLKIISRMNLCDLPKDRSVTLDDFVTMQEANVHTMAEMLKAKNTEIENAVEDLISIVTSFPLDPSVGGVARDEITGLRSHYNKLTYRALLNCSKSSLESVKKRICSRAGSGFLFVERPFFEVDVQLSVPSVRLSPSLDDVQRAINRSSKAVLGCSKIVYDWGQMGIPEEERVALFEKLGCDIEIIKVVLLLTGALHGTKNQVHEYLQTFKKYDWLWKDDKEHAYQKFISSNPKIEAFEAELQKFMAVEQEIEMIPPMHNIGALSLNTANLKLQLRNESRQWKVQYSNKVHEQARDSMYALFEYIRVTNAKLGIEIDGLDSLRRVMDVLKEIRERESSITMEINPIMDMYQMLENYLPGGVIDKEEIDQKSIIHKEWTKLVDYAEDVTDELAEIQSKYRKQLISDVKEFRVDANAFRKDFEENGPVRQGITPMEAVEKLTLFKDALEMRERKLEMYNHGEELFALRTSEFPAIKKTRNEINLLDLLYTLYLDVIETLDNYRKVSWADLSDQYEAMVEVTNGFDMRCRKLPKKLKEWEAYLVLRKKITDFQDMLPLVEELSKDSVKPRHWHEIIKLTGTTYPFDSEAFALSHILDSNILEFKEEVEEIAEGADKQLQIETKLAEVKEMWSRRNFEFGMWKDRGVQILLAFGAVIEDLEDAQLQLQTLLSMRHVAPFRSEVQDKLTELSNTTDELELWVKVQMMWTALESVFMGGDIAKQMPLEAKKFNKVDKDWIKIMQKAAETANVVACCKNELLKNTLPVLYAELERCQKSLEGYLEQKRNKFPRFYFVSNPVLLLILSQGSDPLQMQPYYEKVFDSISQVVHDKGDKTLIKQIKSISGTDVEVIPLNQDVKAVGNIEDWLRALEDRMQKSMKALCETAAATCGGPLREFVDAQCGQFALLGIQFNWTLQCQTALEKCKTSKGIMSETNKQQTSILTELSSWCLQDLGSKMNRTKIETLVTIHVHQKDVFSDMTKLYKERKIQDANDFEWLKQARFYWRPNVEDRHGPGASIISVCDTDFKYAWEYLGCKERLVITPLTDRCYITLTQALGMYLGGAPAGPAGTGKTETTKDLGRTLGIFVVVTNCTDQQRFTDMAKIFKGLCQAGLWGCFDEFNRIELPVLSVVAQQVLSITNAKRTNSKTFTFPGDAQVVTLNPDVGYFITMNPGYAGRQELPENLKALFRGVTMMVPDREIIMKVKLCSVGYSSFVELARKFNVLYRLCEQQLSKQKHYDFGLRNILSVLRTAGATKRQELKSSEEVLVLRTLRDMNLSKLVSQDIPLFLSLLSDLFPNISMPSSGNDEEMETAVNEVIKKSKLVAFPSWVLKNMQLYDTTKVRHGIMLVGPAGAGKTSILNTLSDSLASTTGIQHKRIRMNPKAIRAEEMFGETDKLSGEWTTGIFAAIWQKYNNRANTYNMWIVADGPVDAIWIENLNTVLDDNKILTLANGDRIPMTDNVKIMFEVEDLRNASPATVSRAGIIYVSASDLDWAPVVEAWANKKEDRFLGEHLSKLFKRFVGECEGDKEVGHLFRFMNRNCKQVMSLSRVAMATKCYELLDVMVEKAELSESPSDKEMELERLFLFALTWSVGGMFEMEDRAKFDEYLREFSQVMPPKQNNSDTVYMFNVNSETMEWERWEAPSWTYPSYSEELDFATLLVPTIDSTRALYLMDSFGQKKKPVLLCGGSGTSKTSTAEMYFEQLDTDRMLVKRVNFSFATTPSMFQLSIDGELDKRGGKNFGPPSGKKMTVFLDDMSMPEVNNWGDQPTNELVRQLVETKGYAFLDKDKRGDIKIIEDLQFVGAMNNPGGGKNDIPNRLKRHFFAFNMTVPPVETILNIYGQMMDGRFPADQHEGEFAKYVSKIPTLTIELWKFVRMKMLPSPAKFMYVWNIRELSRVFQGILRAPKAGIENEHVLGQLWRHECMRVFGDKLAIKADKDMFQEKLDKLTSFLLLDTPLDEILNLGGGAEGASSDKKDMKKQPTSRMAKSRSRTGQSMRKSMSAKSDKKAPGGAAASELSPELQEVKDKLIEPTYFVDFLRDDEYDEDGVLVAEAPKVYEKGESMDSLTERSKMFLERFNEEMPGKKMNLILFEDAMRHLMRVSRLIGTPRGNMLFVGVGGSGKQSLTRLAAFMGGHHLFQLVLNKGYNVASLLDDFRELYKIAGQQGKGVVFLMTDAEVKDENFLEVINSVLMTGEITNLFPKDELQVMSSELRAAAFKERPDFVDTPENLVSYFFDRVRANLHIVLAFSPVNPKLPERARKFPGLINGCSINFFLEWPEEALVAVSKGFLGDLDILCEEEVKTELIHHVGSVHNMVVKACKEYFVKMRRHVYQTPKSYLSFLNSYAAMYGTKMSELEEMSNRVTVGLEKLQQGAEDVETMKVVLADEEVKLRKAEEATNAMLSKLELSSMAAKKEQDAVALIKQGCEADKERIAGEKALAEEDLAKAQPFVDEAERAVNSIKPNDLNELKKLGKPGDIIKLIFDCVALLKMEKMVRIEQSEVVLGIGKEKQTIPFFKDSFKIQQTGMLSDSKFLNSIFFFSKYEKDYINDETIEFLLPYLELEGFNPLVARNASKAAEGLCTWARAMKYYHEASKIVKPKLEALSLAEAMLADAQRELDKAQKKLEACEEVLQKLQLDFENQMGQKKAIEENAAHTRRKMEQATALIDGLAGERQRWTEDSQKFDDTKQKLVGDVGIACAFISYCGPFNQTFRGYIVKEKLLMDLRIRNIPVTLDLKLSEFLVDAGTVGDWSMEGLPSDPLSVQNGIMVTRSTRYPLLIDPQGQALAWIKEHEKDKLPGFGTTTLGHPKLREQLEFCMCEGKALIIASVENEIDAMLTSVLEKQIITKAKSKYINISDKLCEYSDDFMLYMTTRLPNPHFSPEDQAKTTMVDFTVTQKGLEEQLLGRVIGKEQKSLEEQLTQVMQEVTSNTKALLKLDQLLLERLSANTGNLLDDEELISVLANTKAKATEVNTKLIAAGETRISINEKREQYRPVATRGSVMYFCIVDVSMVNVMYQTSLDQFQVLFDASMDNAEKASLASKRVGHILEEMTYSIWRYIDRGLYTQDKNSFKLMLVLKILLTAERLTSGDVTLFLKGGAALNINSVIPKAFSWMTDASWLNCVQLMQDKPIFKMLLDGMTRDEEDWKAWYNSNEPETEQIPGLETQLKADRETGPFLRMLLVRSLREDRTLLAGLEFIKAMEIVDGYPAMGERYIKPVSDTTEGIYAAMDCKTPVIYLLSAGADPTDSIEQLAKKKRRDVTCVSMGEGQDVVAMRAINSAMVNGSWVMLQNSHLGLDFMDGLEDLLHKIAETCNEDFRLFITSEPHPLFPIGLLQMCTKITNEPPNGLKAGLLRSYTAIVDQDKLERIETPQWRTLLYGICFLHSVVQERRKFGPLGWCVPYEYNDGDLTACLTFLEKHLYTSSLSWPTLQYMVWEAQYGGKITDNFDRRLFGSYVDAWLSPMTLAPSFTFNPATSINRIPEDFDYVIPSCSDDTEYQNFIKTFPSIDSPEIFGMHPNADLTFRNKEVTQLISTILETQPKTSSDAGGGKSREDVVRDKCTELLSTAPENYVEDVYMEQIAKMGGLGIPLNIFLMQEVQRFNGVLSNVKSSMSGIIQAIRGEVVTTDLILAGINSIFDARVPDNWMFSAGGDEISWISPTLGMWYAGLVGRDAQFRNWVMNAKRPASFWLTGFSNPQGFLTGIQQEVTRSHKADKWSLDSVDIHTEVTEYDRAEQVVRPPKEGCYVHGLFLEGAAWSKGDISLVESTPKVLYVGLPVLFVTAVTKSQKKNMEGDYGPNGGFVCAVYKYPKRTDRFYVFSVVLATREKAPRHWIMRGVALLCSTD